MSEANQESLQEIFAYYAAQPDRGRQEQIVAMLREVQQTLGCVPDGVLASAAQAAGVKESFVAAIIKRTPSLKRAAWRHCIIACTGPRCGAKGGAAVYAALRKALDVDSQGLSADGRVMLRTQNCLKRCPSGPNVLVDGVPVGGMTAQDVPGLLAKLD